MLHKIINNIVDVDLDDGNTLTPVTHHYTCGHLMQEFMHQQLEIRTLYQEM